MLLDFQEYLTEITLLGKLNVWFFWVTFEMKGNSDTQSFLAILTAIGVCAYVHDNCVFTAVFRTRYYNRSRLERVFANSPVITITVENLNRLKTLNSSAT